MADLLQRKGSAGVNVAQELGPPHPSNELEPAQPKHKLDGPAAREVHRKLMQWYYYERDRQAINRLEMALDHDFYDGDQWSEDDKAVLEERKQAPLVFNEVAPMTDWLVGTERRARVDWKILPRTEDDVEMADVKTKLLKYVSDVNSCAFQRSRAFADAVKVGLGWVDDGVRDDPTQEILYSRYEDWRNVLMDSAGLDLAGNDARYIYRWRWVDEDIALAMFPDRAHRIRQSAEDWSLGKDVEDNELEGWQSPLENDGVSRRGGTMSPYAQGMSGIGAERRRVKLIECQWREPVATKFVQGGSFNGAMFDPRDKVMEQAIAEQSRSGRVTIIDRIVMRVHVAIMTEAYMLSMGTSIYRHNQFSLTPIVCYRRGRDRQWYGAIRRVRDLQQDLNKRASRALWFLNGNQIEAEEGAFPDLEEAREEAQRPDGIIVRKPGRQAQIRRDADAATGHMQFMALDQQSIQRSGGVTDENLGRQTNAVSGEAIKARQLQGSVVTTEPFDNLRFAVHEQGRKQLSLVEQFYSEEKVIRLTGAQVGQIEWVKLNVPEVQADGSVRYINDVTASMADFVVAEADYAGSARQAMFESLMQIAQRLPPEVALRLLRMAFEFSDLPNKQEIADEIRRMTGESDPSKKMTPEEEAQAQQQAAMQQEAMQMQRAQAIATLEEQQARVREINARAEKLLAEAGTVGASAGGDAQAEIERAVAEVRAQAAQQIDRMSQQLAKMQSSNEAEIYKANKAADTAAMVERIRAANKAQLAEIAQPSSDALARIEERLGRLEAARRPAAGKAK